MMSGDVLINVLRACKLCLMRVGSVGKGWIFRCRGIQVGKGCGFSGWPSFTRKRGCRIILEEGVGLHSARYCNRLIDHPCSLDCIVPGAQIIMHKGSGMSGSRIVCSTKVEIGEYTMIGAGCVIYDCKQHEYYPENGWGRHPKSNEGKPIVIGKRCFIGMKCIILRGVTIGDNCVISAGTIITRDVPAGHLAMGNPAVYYPLSERLRTTPEGIVALPTEG